MTVLFTVTKFTPFQFHFHSSYLSHEENVRRLSCVFKTSRFVCQVPPFNKGDQARMHPEKN